MTTQAPIDTNPHKNKRVFKPPMPEKYPVAGEGRHIVPLVETLASAGSSGQAIADISIRALERAEETHSRVYDAMHAVNVEQAQMEKAGHPAARIVQTPEGLRAVGTKFAELADATDPLLAKEQERIDAAIRNVASHQEAMLKKMDESLICSQTAADAPLRSDMRAHLRVLGQHKASYEAIKAATNKDKTMVHVVLTSPPALMGLKPDDIEAVRNEARKSMNPELFKAHAEAGKVIERMIVASKAINKKREKVASYRIADQQAANDALKALRSTARA